MRLSKQEADLVCIYYSGSQINTATQMREALSHIDEPDVIAFAESAIGKLVVMRDDEFSALVSQEAAS